MIDVSSLWIVGAGVLRSVGGWVENALDDGEISEFEWKQLGSTVIRVGVFGVVALYLPGVDLSGVEAAASGFLLDVVVKALKR